MAASSPIVTCTAPVNIAVIKYCNSRLSLTVFMLTPLSLQGERGMKLSFCPSTTR